MIQWLTHDWKMKAISLALAIGLWYYATGEESIEVTRTVPLEIKVKNERMSVLRTSVRHVQVNLAAPRALLPDLTSEDIKVVHEIGAEVKTAGDYSFRIESYEIKVPKPQIRVTGIMPETVAVTMDELMVQKLKISPNFVGEPALGYNVRQNEIQMDPNAIMVEGPKGQLEKLESIPTEPIELVGRVRAVRRTVKLNIPANLKPLSDALVDIYIPIGEEFAEKKFENVPVRILKSLEKEMKVDLEPQKVAFVLKGSRRELEKLMPEKIVAYVDLSGLGAGDHQIPVSLILPPEIVLKENTTLTLKASIKK